MENELDFNADVVPRNRQGKYIANRATPIETLLAVMATIFLLLLSVGIGVEWRFWWLWAAGRRADAVITQKEQRIVGWAPGLNLPLVETGIHYVFVDAAENRCENVVWLRAGAWRYAVGDSLPVIYGRGNSANNMPGSISHHFATDDIWNMMLILDILALIGMVVCVGMFVFLRNRRIRRWTFLMAAAASEEDDSAEATS